MTRKKTLIIVGAAVVVLGLGFYAWQTHFRYYYIQPTYQTSNQQIEQEYVTAQDVIVGNGAEVVAGDDEDINATYVGRLPDGTIFDNIHSDDTSPLIRRLGSGELPLGLEQGLLGMKVGGVRIVTIPASSTLTTVPAPPPYTTPYPPLVTAMQAAPPNSIIIYEITLNAIAESRYEHKTPPSVTP